VTKGRHLSNCLGHKSLKRDLRLLEEIAKGEREIFEGKGIPHATIKDEVAQWVNRKN